MKLTRVGLVSLGCVAGAIACGIAANAAIDLVMPSVQSAKAVPSIPVAAVKAQDPASQEQPAAFELASAASIPIDLGPVKIKTVPIVVRDGELIEQVLNSNPTPRNATASRIPLPRPRPASAPVHEATASIARQPASLAISAATRKPVAPDEGEALSAANIDRMKMALALTAEQEEFWPAVAAELRAIGKTLSHQSKAKGQASKINVDDETKQRLYWAAAPLITRLSYEQKLKAKQMARLMGLNEVAEAL